MPRYPRRPARLRALSFSVALCLSCRLMAQDAPAYDFDLPAAPLSTSLMRIASTSGHLLSVDPAVLEHRQAAPVHGHYSGVAAAEAALAGSGLALQTTADGAWTVGPAAAVPSHAAPPKAPAPGPAARTSTRTLEGMQVYGSYESGYAASTSRAGTKTDASLLETPEAISVVTRSQMDAQGVQNVPQALRYAPGILTAQRGFSQDGGGQEEMYVRGFLVDQYLDGLRLPSRSVASYGASAVDPYALERVELVHGPASVLYGQSSPGGLVNLVSKTPTDTPLHEVGIQTGSYARKQLQFDMSDALSDSVDYRLVGLGRSSNTQVDHVQDKRVLLAPSVRWRATDATVLTVVAGYQHDPDAGYYNTLPYVGTGKPAPFGRISSHLDPGDPDFDEHRRTQYWLGYRLEHAFNDSWKFVQSARYMDNRDTLQSVFANGWAWNDGSLDNHTLGRYALAMHEATRTLTADNQLQGHFDTGSATHEVLVGVDYQRTLYRQGYGYNWFGVPGLDVLAPAYGAAIDVPENTADQHTRLSQSGIYAQDLIRWGHWRALVAGREDWAKADTTDSIAGTAVDQSKHKFTTHLGLTYVTDIGLAPYLSYATSFQPQATASLEGGGTPAPTTGKQYELGVKYQPVGKQSFMSLAAYHLVQQNVLTTDPLTLLQYVTGEVRSRGIEAEAHAQITDSLAVIGSYTWLQQLNTRTREPDELDKRSIGIPRNTAALWLDYHFQEGALQGLGVSLGGRYVGGSYGDAANTFTTPSYAVLDAGMRYERQGWDYSLTVSNLSDRRYVASCLYSQSACNFGSRRSVLLGANYRW
ncbi:TonB-dependent siderophore receptor [Luteibacter aegosomaticola]|uniref:TonB-dependent siderophore receptor n=1 Tax=Luteibacter aegosomaticola TaxID=2911538 RepID=UPI001FF86865|nr:TonB-dependent siderophore receptor [Luteibacter aegosomaticola]UPG89634.1 TonB-dependent siderophore receptor [Luteibacter aegosomaticola]